MTNKYQGIQPPEIHRSIPLPSMPTNPPNGCSHTLNPSQFQRARVAAVE